jgi:hypothetical protein
MLARSRDPIPDSIPYWSATMRRLLLVAALVAFGPAHASGVNFHVSPTDCVDCQSAFEGVVEDMSAALNYKALGPAEASGVTGVAVYGFGSYVPVKNDADWKTLTGTDVKQIGMAGVTVRKGLPYSLDLGAFYGGIPGASAGLYGAEVRYAPLAGGFAAPALAVRMHYSRTTGIEDLDYRAWGGDVTLSKGFALLTPYVGLGVTRASADPKNVPATANLHHTEHDGFRAYGGCRVGLGFFDLTPEYERNGSNDAFNLAMGFSF